MPTCLWQTIEPFLWFPHGASGSLEIKLSLRVGFIHPLKFFIKSNVYDEVRKLPKTNPMRQPRSLMINKDTSWGLFDGASKDNPRDYSAEGALYFSDVHYVTFKLGL